MSRRKINRGPSFFTGLRVLALIGLGLSLTLLYFRLSGKIDSLVGCGGNSGCSNVLGSSYSQWFGLPVAAIAAMTYVLVFIHSFYQREIFAKALGISLLGAALWFGGVQVLALKSICPWCVAAHAIGFLTAILLLFDPFRGEAEGEQSETGGWGPGLAFGFIGLAALVTGQLFGPKPDTHRIVDIGPELLPESNAAPSLPVPSSPVPATPIPSLPAPGPSPSVEPPSLAAQPAAIPDPSPPAPSSLDSLPAPTAKKEDRLAFPGDELSDPAVPSLSLGSLEGDPAAGELPPVRLEEPAPPKPQPTAAPEPKVHIHARGKGRQVRFFGGQKNFAIENLPGIGPMNAKHVLIEYFDYRCGSCKDLHGDLKALMTAHPKDIRLVLIPMPLSRQCNPNLPADIPEHAGSCHLAMLSLATFHAAPEHFTRIHDTLFLNSDYPPEKVRKVVESLVGKERLDASLRDPWVAEMLAASAGDYPALTQRSVKMPKLLMGDRQMMEGVAKDRETFLRSIREYLQLK